MSSGDDIQAQNIPADIDWNDPEAVRKVIDVAKRLTFQINQVMERLSDLEEKVLQ